MLETSLLLTELRLLGRLHGSGDRDINEKRHRRQPRNKTDQQQRATNNLDHPDKRGHDLRPRNADCQKATDSEGIGEQKLLYAFGKENPANRIRTSKIAFAARSAQLVSALTGIDLSPRNNRAFRDEVNPVHT